jgi:hypothetical protein
MSDRLLKQAALTDGSVSLLVAVPLIALAPVLAGPLGISPTFLTIAAWSIVPFALMFLWVARTGSRPLATFGVIGNALWVIASVVAIPVLQPTPLGAAFIVGQALAVAAFGWFQYQGLKRVRAAA